VPGNPGRDGIPGSPGTSGAKGEPGEKGNDYIGLAKSNWKQCVWRKADVKNIGLIQVCRINIFQFFFLIFFDL
jgi:hypothetical protein